jgi:hypothetical protein
METGILTIGSLYWDDGERKAWRESRTRLGEEYGEYTVKVPIRYGRKSSKRGSTYTMVYSGSCPAGQAKVLSCRCAVDSAAQIIAEARHLWAVESKTSSLRRISASWGCVALLVRPDGNVPQNFLNHWRDTVRREPAYGRVPQAPGEQTLVDENGLLHIPWPETVDALRWPAPFKLLLATVTHPTLEGDLPAYPTPRMIARAWGEGANDEIAYFRNNRAHGIITFEDEVILHELDRIISPLGERRRADKCNQGI